MIRRQIGQSLAKYKTGKQGMQPRVNFKLAHGNTSRSWQASVTATFYSLLLVVSVSSLASAEDRVQELMNRAQAAQSSSRYDDAAAAYREVIQLKPGWAPAEFNLGMMYFLSRKYPDALALFNASIQHDQPVAAAYMFRGISYFYTGQNERALKSLLKYQELSPNDPQIYKFMAATYFSLGDYGHAALNYLKQTEVTPGEASNYYRLGESYLSLAKDELRKLNQSPHGKYYIWLIAAEAHGRDGGYAAAAPFLDKAMQLDATSAEAFIVQGTIRLGSHLATDAKQSFTQAMRGGQASCRAQEGLFESELALADIDQAIEALTAATSRSSQCRTGLLVPYAGLSLDDYGQRLKDLRERSQRIGTSSLIREIARLDKARTNPRGEYDCGLVSSVSSHDAESVVNRADCLEGQGALRQASQELLGLGARDHLDPDISYRRFGLYMRFSQESIAKLAELSPDSVYLTFMTAQVSEQQGNAKQAEEDYLKAISQPDAPSEVLVAYARFICTQNRLQEAIPFLDRAISLDPFDGPANVLLGKIYFEQNQSEASIKPLQIAVRLFPGEEQVRIDLANSLRRLGRVRDAIATLEAAPADSSGRIHYILSQCYRETGRTEEANNALRIFKERSVNVSPSER